MFIRYVIKNIDSKLTLNDLLKNKFNISSRLLSKLIRNKKILVNGDIFDTRLKCSVEDELFIDFSFEEDNSKIIPTKMDLSII